MLYSYDKDTDQFIPVGDLGGSVVLGMPDYTAGVTIANNATVEATVDSIYYGYIANLGNSAILATLLDSDGNTVLVMGDRLYHDETANSRASVSVFVPKGYSIQVTYEGTAQYSALYPIKGTT